MEPKNFFQAIRLESDRRELFMSWRKHHVDMQVKVSGREGVTYMIVTEAEASTLGAILRSGAPLSPMDEALLFIEDNGVKYFCKGRVQYLADETFFIHVPEVFKLQRRNNFRVSFEGSRITATVVLARREVILLDLSAGGMATLIAEEQTHDLRLVQDHEESVEVRVGDQDPVSVTAKIKNIRHRSHGEMPMLVVGWEFVGISEAIRQRLAFIVNESYRQLFISKMA